MEIEGIIKDRDFKTSLLSDHVIGVTFQHVKLFDPITPPQFQKCDTVITSSIEREPQILHENA